MKVLDLFSGIGGFSLGLERAGMQTVAFCEIDPFCRKVLAKHWPEVPIYEDVTTLDGREFAGVDVICGGFPCQDISYAGLGRGLAGERSGLWFEMSRIIREVRPRFAILENVSALIARGLPDILGDLAEMGLDAEWCCIPASAVGAPHHRDRIWIVAYPSGLGWSAIERITKWLWKGRPLAWESIRATDEQRLAAICNFCGEANGLPNKLDKDRIRALGNAVVPQIPEMIGRAIMQASQALSIARDV